MKLSDLLFYDDVVIQCHNVPDADAIASGYALLKYFLAHGKRARLVYSGDFAVSKSNLLLMIQMFQIPLQYVTELKEPGLLILADCQYRERNVRFFPAAHVAVIDHHQGGAFCVPESMREIRPSYGSCATVVWDMLRKEGFDVNQDSDLASALYYGLYMDTGHLQEIWHPMDKDMRDSLIFSQTALIRLRNCNLSSDELKMVGNALAGHRCFPRIRAAMAALPSCDPNLLGVAGDLLAEVDSVDCCVIYTKLTDGIKFSVRTCVKTARADDLGRYLADGFGSAGGHMTKAGGFIRGSTLSSLGQQDIGAAFSDMAEKRLDDYFLKTDVFYAGTDYVDFSDKDRFRKKCVRVGYCNISGYLSEGTRILVRTMEGEIELSVSSDMVLMIGASMEIYPATLETLNSAYAPCGEPYLFPEDTEYIPTVHNRENGDILSMESICQACTAKGTASVYAKKLKHYTKVFTMWDPDHYISGKPGDWIAARTDHPEDLYIISNSVFEKTYEHEG